MSGAGTRLQPGSKPSLYCKGMILGWARLRNQHAMSFSGSIVTQAGATGRAPADSQQSTSRNSNTSARIYSASQYGPNHTKKSADSTSVINRARSVRSVHAAKKHRKAGTDEGHQHLVTLADVQQQYQAQLVSAPFSNTGGHLQLHSREIRYGRHREYFAFIPNKSYHACCQ